MPCYSRWDMSRDWSPVYSPDVGRPSHLSSQGDGGISCSLGKGRGGW